MGPSVSTTNTITTTIIIRTSTTNHHSHHTQTHCIPALRFIKHVALYVCMSFFLSPFGVREWEGLTTVFVTTRCASLS